MKKKKFDGVQLQFADIDFYKKEGFLHDGKEIGTIEYEEYKKLKKEKNKK